jgi:steroid delta-isomerase-like uncharacterized protein
MPTEENKAIVLEFYQAFDDRNIEQAFELLAPNFVAHMAGLPKPLDILGFRDFGMKFYSAFTDSKHQFEQVIVEDSKVVTCGTFTAKHLGEFQGIPPTNKQVEISIMHIDCVENGKIVEHWGQGDAQGLMQQLGIIFLPGAKLVPSILKNIFSKLLWEAIN